VLVSRGLRRRIGGDGVRSKNFSQSVSHIRGVVHLSAASVSKGLLPNPFTQTHMAGNVQGDGMLPADTSRNLEQIAETLRFWQRDYAVEPELVAKFCKALRAQACRTRSRCRPRRAASSSR
jgi:hypothetical protein